MPYRSQVHDSLTSLKSETELTELGDELSKRLERLEPTDEGGEDESS